MKRLIQLGAVILLIVAMWFYNRNTSTSPEQNKKILVTVKAAKIKGLDPIQSGDVYGAQEVAKVYEGLLEYHYLKRPYELIPNLAAAMPTVSEDGLVYTFKLKEGVKFHDNACFPDGKGRELVAKDFVYAIKRAADPKLQSPQFSIIAGKIKGLDEWRNKYAETAQADYTEAVAGLKAIDQYTLQFTLNQAYPQFLYILAMQFCDVVPQEAVQHYGTEFLNHPVGTGPFTLEEFNPQFNKLVYRKNPNFRDKRFPSEASEAYEHLLVDAGKPLPLVDKVITHILPEEQPRWLKFQQGQIDVIDISRDTIVSEVVQADGLIPAMKEKGIQLFQELEHGTSFFVINCRHELFRDNIKLRQALSMAFDGQKHNELFYQGGAVLAQSIIPPGLAGYRADYVNPYRTYDLEKAKKLLAEAGYPDGKGLPTITLDVHSSTNSKQKAEFFQKCMEQIGVQVNVVANIWPELTKKINQKTTMMHALSWIADYPDAGALFYLLYRADTAIGMGCNFNDPVYNALYEKATVMQPSPEKTTLYEQLNRLAAEGVPAVYTVHQMHPILYHCWVKNYLWSDFHYGTEQYINIDLEQKQALQSKF